MDDNDTRLDHVAVAVRSLAAAEPLFGAIVGRAAANRETIESEEVRVAFFDLGGVRLELLEPTRPDSPVGRFLERRGPGLHHVAFAVADLDAALARCRTAGLRTVGEAPRTGAGGRRVAFLHPADAGGVLIELSETRQRPTEP